MDEFFCQCLTPKVYGCYAWLHGGKNDTPLSVTRISKQGKFVWSGVAFIGSLS